MPHGVSAQLAEQTGRARKKVRVAKARPPAANGFSRLGEILLETLQRLSQCELLRLLEKAFQFRHRVQQFLCGCYLTSETLTKHVDVALKFETLAEPRRVDVETRIEHDLEACSWARRGS